MVWEPGVVFGRVWGWRAADVRIPFAPENPKKYEGFCMTWDYTLGK